MRKIRTVLLIIFSIVLALNMELSAAGTAPSSGDGTSTNPYQIATLDNLLWLSTTSSVWDKCFIQTADIDASATSTWNPDGSGGYYGFSPIGYTSPYFTGTYDGQGHTISHLYINRSDDKAEGLFGYAFSGATIKNLGLISVDITSSSDAGALIGSNIHSLTVTNCYSSGSVLGRYEVGGLIGYTRNYSGETNAITNCFSKCNVSGVNSGDVGGLVGKAYGASDGSGNLEISNCYSSGSVSGTYNVGGLVGKNYIYCKVENCYSLADVHGINDRVGGLVGYNYYHSSIANSYSKGQVSGSSSVGGLVGNNDNGRATVTNSFWDTQTSGQSLSDGGTGKTTSQMKTESTFTDAGWDFVGESANGSDDYWDINTDRNLGYPYLSWQTFAEGTAPSSGDGTSGNPYQISALDNLLWLSAHPSSWDKNFIQTANIDASATQSWDLEDGFSPIGNETTKFTGVYDGDSHTIGSLHIDRSGKYYQGVFGYTNGATIKNLGVTDVDISGKGISGGLVGKNENSSEISHSYAIGSVSGNGADIGGLTGYNNATISYCYSSCTVNSTDDYTGGLVGNNEEIISNSYATGNVTTTEDYAGGLVGSNDGTISKSYATGNVTTSGNDAGGLVGFNMGTSVSNCYSRGSVSGGYEVGGLIGGNYADVSNSYSTGSVSGTGDVGGLIGYNNSKSTINNSFWDKETSGQSTSAGGTDKTTSQMKAKATFTDAGWDFVGETANGSNDYWNIDGSKNDGYPILYGIDGTLPVTLSSFSANVFRSSVELNWQTATEVNNYGFRVERKKEKVQTSWENIGFVEGHGNSNSPKEYSFTDENSPSGSIQYRLKQIDIDGNFEYSEIVEVEIGAPVKFELLQNYPNPFNPTTTIKYKVPKIEKDGRIVGQRVKIIIYNALVSEIATLVDEIKAPGNYSVRFDASGLSSGIYFYALRTDNFIRMKKMILMK